MMALKFSEEDFQEAWRELDHPAIQEPWQLFTESMGFQIYRLQDQESGLYQYKVYGGLSDCLPELFADVYMDLEYRKKWDQYVNALREVESEEDPVIYWEVKYPFPLANRDYVYVRERQDLDVDGRKIFVILAKSVSVNHCPEKSGIIRVTAYKQSLAIESDGSSGCKVFMYYFDNPGGMLPSWLINWTAKSGVPSFLTDMEKACKGYNQSTVKTPSN
ncbi:phosphatidylcholine transfer [Pelobates cultripes]|uniref:Phosphatidylcholine transfer protein n=1 Tax=Pelobates cultripes TaxID=61616 RepID=A0AAD1S4J0_PELCU|nr:phosphatidylcholine transfer [Pelobates cultripes]